MTSCGEHVHPKILKMSVNRQFQAKMPKYNNSSAMAVRPRDACSSTVSLILYCDVLVTVGFTCCQVTRDCRHGKTILRAWVTLRLNFRLEVTFRANICILLDRGIVTGYYNFVAGSFHTKKLETSFD